MHIPTISLSRHNRYLRLFCWAWDANPYQLDNCRFFWGTFLLPLAILTRGASDRIWRRLIRIQLFVGLGLAVLGYLTWGGLAAFGVGLATGALITIGTSWLVTALYNWAERREAIKARRGPTPRKPRPTLDRLAARGDALAERVFDKLDAALDSKPAEHVGNVWSILTFYIKNFKTRTCHRIVVE